MNEERSFERFVADNVAGQSQGTPLPDDFYDDMHSFASGTRQRPEWLALIKEPPMRTNSHLAVGSPTVRVAAIIVATLLLAVALAAAGVAGQRLLAADDAIVVAQDGTGDYGTIQEAVAAAEAGDEILIKAGTYTGPVDIDKDISVSGEDRKKVIVEFGFGCTEDEQTETTTCPDEAWLYSGYSDDAWPYGISMIETEAQLSDLTIRKSPDVGGSGFVVKGGAPRISRVTYTGQSDFGNVLVHGGSRAVISESEFGPMWVFFEEESPATIENSIVDGTIRLHTNTAPPTDEPQVVRGNTAAAIMLRGNAVVADNVMDQAQIPEEDRHDIAIDVDNGEYLISGNEISHYPTGITVNGPGAATIENNTLTDNNTAIVDGSTSDQVIDGNTISGGGGGIFVTGSGTHTVSENTISGLSRRAIGINGVGSVLLSGNHACGNGEDLYVSSGSEAVIEDDNEFCVIVPSE